MKRAASSSSNGMRPAILHSGIKLVSWSVRGRKFKAEVKLPSPKHEAVVWFEEDPENKRIDVFLELRQPIECDDCSISPKPTKFIVEKNLERMLPGKYEFIRVFVQGKLFGMKKAGISQD